MENNFVAGTTLCGPLLILGGIWTISLARNPIRNRLRLSVRANKIVTFLVGVIMILFGILVVSSGIIMKPLP